MLLLRKEPSTNGYIRSLGDASQNYFWPTALFVRVIVSVLISIPVGITTFVAVDGGHVPEVLICVLSPGVRFPIPLMAVNSLLDIGAVGVNVLLTNLIYWFVLVFGALTLWERKRAKKKVSAPS
jgi:hypothetical protein